MKKKISAGVDIHKEKYVGCILDEKGKVVRELSFPPTKEGAQSFFCGLPVNEVAIEACGMWRGAMKLFRELGYKVRLTHPKTVKDIAGKKKTDRVDAKTLANLLRTEYLPEVYIPKDNILRLRDIARHKCLITRLKVNVQLKIKAYLLLRGIKYPSGLWSKKGLKWLEGIQDLNIKSYLKLYYGMETEEKETMKRIRKMSNSMRLTKLLMTMPGIAHYSALMIIGEIADIKRFKTPKELVMYTGLCPGKYQTGNTERDVYNHSVNKYLKWIITECSGRASMLENKFMRHYSKIKQRKTDKIARRSTARKMITIIWHMLHNQEPYRHAS